ncbi:MAG: hypothetical protein ABI432_03195 [Flavobacteriales bacterium]
MKHLKTITTLAIVFALSLGSHAQITVVGTGPNGMRVVRSLPNAGVKLYTKGAAGVTLYNLDLSVYTTIDYPALDPAYSYFDVLYFTENTFDTDPSTIELMMLTVDTDYVSGTRVFTQDGTVLVDDLLFGFSGVGGYDEVNAKPPLFTGEDGMTYMILTGSPDGAPPYSSKLYQLPGVLPCMDCAGIIGMGMDQQAGGDGSALGLYPNPTTDMVRVEYTLPVHAASPKLLVNDAAGRCVLTVPLDASGLGSFSMGGQPSGSYACSLVAGVEVLGTQRLVLAR